MDRPVDLTSHILKVLERLLLAQLSEQLKTFHDPILFAYCSVLGIKMPSSTSFNQPFNLHNSRQHYEDHVLWLLQYFLDKSACAILEDASTTAREDEMKNSDRLAKRITKKANWKPIFDCEGHSREDSADSGVLVVHCSYVMCHQNKYDPFIKNIWESFSASSPQNKRANFWEEKNK